MAWSGTASLSDAVTAFLPNTVELQEADGKSVDGVNFEDDRKMVVVMLGVARSEFWRGPVSLGSESVPATFLTELRVFSFFWR